MTDGKKLPLASNAVTALILALSLPSVVAMAAEADASIEQIIADNSYTIALDGRELTGDGLQWLLDEADAAQFFLFGEQHATADIARSAEALFRAMATQGYSVAVVEVGPWSTPIMERKMRAEGDRSYEAFMADPSNRLTFPFFFFREEADFATAVIEVSPENPALWGVDQEFVAAGSILLAQLAASADTPEKRAAVETARTSVGENPMALGTGPDEPWEHLAEAFKDGESGNLMSEMLLSRRIYAPFTGRGGNIYDANFLRENYMKARLLDHLERFDQEHDRWPRAFFKFGANHVAYGHSPTDVLSLGTFVSEVARTRGMTTFSLHVDCRGGLVSDPRSGEHAACDSYFLGEASNLGKFIADDKPTLIDLRALRPHRRLWADWDEKSRQLILAYDAYLALPDVKPASLF